MATAAQTREREHELTELRAMLHPGDTVYTILRHVSQSGMMRVITPLLIPGGQRRYLTYAAATILRYSRKAARGGDGVVMNGCGMEMGFSLVYNLSYALFPEGFGEPCTNPTGPDGARCGYRPASREQAAMLLEVGACLGCNQAPVYHGRNNDPSGWDHDGGYALRQEWL